MSMRLQPREMGGEEREKRDLGKAQGQGNKKETKKREQQTEIKGDNRS